MSTPAPSPDTSDERAWHVTGAVGGLLPGAGPTKYEPPLLLTPEVWSWLDEKVRAGHIAAYHLELLA